jgi:hypothetical protein
MGGKGPGGRRNWHFTPGWPFRSSLRVRLQGARACPIRSLIQVSDGGFGSGFMGPSLTAVLSRPAPNGMVLQEAAFCRWDLIQSRFG